MALRILWQILVGKMTTELFGGFIQRPTGQEIFDSLTEAEQDEMLGPEAAEKVRKGEATLSDFVKVEGGFITQRPAEDL